MFKLIKKILKSKENKEFERQIYRDTFRYSIFDFDDFNNEIKEKILESFKNTNEYHLCKDWNVNFEKK